VSYHGLISHAKRHLLSIDTPLVLEVGVDRGVTYITLAYFLARARENFVIIGVDIKVQEQVQIMLMSIDRNRQQQQCYLYERNSLDFLPELEANSNKFDVVLLDGDHNYYTVSKELEMINNITHGESIVIVDDAQEGSRWANRDLFYATREDYDKVLDATAPIETEKHGVRPAVLDFVEAHGWKIASPVRGEPVVLCRSEDVLKKFCEGT